MRASGLSTSVGRGNSTCFTCPASARSRLALVVEGRTTVGNTPFARLATRRERWKRLGIGGQLGLRGPFGTGWPLDECPGADLILVAGGIGLAPLRSAIHKILSQRSRWGRVTLIYGARTADSLLYTAEYSRWTQDEIIVQTTVDRATLDWRGNIGVVPLLLDRLRPLEPRNSILMACGPEVMMRYTVRSALERGMTSDQICLALERNMQFAVGFCGHCQLGPAFVCKDGPVFRHDRIAPFLQVENL